MLKLILLICAPLAAQDQEALVRRLASDDYFTREAATSALVEMKIEAALPILARALGQRDPEVQARAHRVLLGAAERLCAMPIDEAAPIVSRALSHPHPATRAWAERVRARLQQPVLRPPDDADSPFGTVSLTIIVPAPAPPEEAPQIVIEP